jgi:hypothetical protein
MFSESYEPMPKKIVVYPKNKYTVINNKNNEVVVRCMSAKECAKVIGKLPVSIYALVGRERKHGQWKVIRA